MIKSIRIQNFKSVVDLSLELGSFNVLVGENGCGKSNILEAIAMGAAANADKLDTEYFGNRGLRLTSPEFMFSAFSELSNIKRRQAIELTYKVEDKTSQLFQCIIAFNPLIKKWVNIKKESAVELADEIGTLLFDKSGTVTDANLKKIIDNDDAIAGFKDLASRIESTVANRETGIIPQDVFKVIFTRLANSSSNEIIANYIIYSPEQGRLRKFEEANQIQPIGYRGEGLFQYLKELSKFKKNKKTLEAIRNSLALLDWYENFEIPDDSVSTEYSLKIKDKYINPTLNYFDQRSTNEGFLFLLFYSTVFISKDTPTFFAIENIDTSFNPKLCMKLIKTLAALAKKNNKQVIVTTQNPAILDGLNLKDDNQRLFVVRRNDDGHTRVNRIEHKEGRRIKLSEVWTSGFIGGLPENF